MKAIRLRHASSARLLISVLFGVVAFQNCSGVEFSAHSSSSDSSSSIPVNSIPEITCTGFVALSPGANGVYLVPGRTGDGTCYSVQVMTAIPDSNSDLTKTFDTLALANNHGIPGDSGYPVNPYMMEHANIVLSLAGPRRMSLSGAVDQTTSITVDNFLMVGFGAARAQLSAPNYLAYGTADSAPPNMLGFVEFETQPVPLAAFASGGIASVGNVDISQSIAPGSDYQLDLRADDCGVERQLSNIYVIFQ